MADNIVSSGEVRSGIILNYNDSMTVLDGGTATDTTVNSEGKLIVSSGGTATDVIENGGYVRVEDGAEVTFTSNTVSGLSLSSASATVHSGTVVKDADINGCLNVYDGGSAINTTVAPNGRLCIESNGITNGIQVNEGGSLFVYSGGTALNIVENGGYVMVGKETNVTFVSNTISNIDVRNGSVTIHSGTTANNTTIGVSNGYLYVNSGGVVNDTTVNDGYIHISSGGSAIGVLINHRGNIIVSSGGRLSGRMICLHRKIYVSNAFLDFDLTESLPGDAALLNDFSCVSGTPFYTTTVNADQAEGIYFLAENAGSFKGTISVVNKTGEYLGTLVLGETITISDIKYTLSLSDDMLSLKIGENNTPSPYTSNGLIISGNTAEKTIESGEVFLNTLIVSSGALKILSGGIADRTLVKNSNGLTVFSGGTANRTTINDFGDMTVASGGTAIYTTVSSSGRLYVSSGGTALNVTESGGYVEIADDADVSFTNNVFSCLLNDAATVHSGTTANSVIVDGSGKLFIYSGGKADNTELYGYGQTASMFVYSGGTANNTNVTNGRLYISSGGITNNTTVNSGGNIHISNGGTANSTTVNRGGNMFISSGGTMTGKMTFEEVTRVSAYEGAIFDFDISELPPVAEARVNNLAIIQGTPTYTLTVSDEQQKGIYLLAEGAAGFDGSLTVQNTLGEEIGAITVGGELETENRRYTLNLEDDRLYLTCYALSAGRVIENETVTVSEYEIYRNPVVNSTGRLIVSSGGTAVETVENGGYVYVADGANVTFASHSFSGLILSWIDYARACSATIHSGTTANSTVVCDKGAMFAYSGGIINNIIVSSKGRVSVSSGGKLTGKVICLGDINMDDGAILDFDLTHVQPGTAAVVKGFPSGDPLYTITINPDEQKEGIYALAEGRTVFDHTVLVVNTTGEELGMLSLGETITISDVAYTLSLSDRTLNLTIGESNTPSPYTSDGLILNAEKEVKDQDYYHDTLIVSGGRLRVSSGGQVETTTVFGNSNGKAELILSYGGMAADTTVMGDISGNMQYGGHFSISSGGTADNTKVRIGGRLTVSSGGTAIAVVEDGGYIDVLEGANVAFVPNAFSIQIMSNASATVHSGTTAFSTTVDSSGKLYVSSGGIASSTMVCEKGEIYVSSGGIATDIMVNGGRLEISSGGIANQTMINGGELVVSSGGTANDTRMNNDGMIRINSGGIINDTVINLRSGLSYDGYFQIRSGGIANNTTFSYYTGYMLVDSGGLVINTTINYMGSNRLDRRGGLGLVGGTAKGTVVSAGTLIIGDTGKKSIAIDTIVKNEGVVYLLDDCIMTGEMFFEDGAIVFAEDGAIFDFDISELTPEAGARVNNLAIIQPYKNGIVQGPPKYTFTLTVSDEQQKGVYLLAEGAAGFDGTITVQSTLGEEIGSITVGGELETENRRYTLNLEDDRLCLTCYALTTGRVIENEIVTVSEYETIRDAVVLSGGKLYVSSSGTADSATVNSGGSLSVSSGGTANSTTVNFSGRMDIANDGTATEIKENGGYVSVADGAEVTFAPNTINELVLENASATIHSGTTAVSTTIQRGSMFVFSSGTANSTTVNSGGSMRVSSGGTANSTTINSGYLFVSSGGTATEILENGGYVFVSSGGTANSTTVNSGTLYVSSGGTATEILENGGYVLVEDDAVVTFVPNIMEELLLENKWATIHSGTTVNSAVVNSGGRLIVSSGGTVSEILENGGYVLVEDDAVVTFVPNIMEELLLENKWATIHSGTTVNSAVVNSGGGLIVSSGGTASEILENGGYVVVEEGAEVSFIPNTFSGLILSSLSATVHSVTNATDITVMSSGSLIVFSGGTANHLTAISGGSLTVSSGGMANHMTVNYGSLGIIGGTVNDVTVNEGDLRVYKGGTVNHVTCYGSLFIDKYGTVTDATINPRGSATVYTGGTANHTTVNSGLLDVRGGTVNDVTVNGGGRLIIYKGGTATEIKENGGYVEITSGADVSFVPNTIYGLGFSGGSGVPMPISSATIHSGTTAIYTTLYLTSGNLTIFSGGTANGTTVGGRMTISEGGVATHTALCNGSLGIIGGSADITLVQGYNDISMFVSNGGTADHTIITRGTLEVGKRGTANSTVVAGNGAVFTVHYGGTANGVTVNSGGSVNVNGKLTGRIVSLNGGLISANGTLDFDLNQVSPGNGARINNLSCISGNLVYTITVNADQAEGIYTLANDASAFDQTITVVNVAGETLGTLTVGETTAISGIDYTLSLSDGTLSLTVGTTVTPSPYTSDGLILSNRSTTIKQGEVFHDTVLVSGSLVIKSGGLADNVMVWSGGKVTVSSGGEINSAIVNKNCRLEARSGGTAHNIIVNEGGCATGIVLNNGDNLTVFSSGSAYAVVNDGGCLYVFNGGSAGATVNSGGLVNGITLDSKSSSYSPLIVSSGGTAVFTTINKSGSLIASGGAHLERTYVNSGGSLHISDGVVANNTVISGKSGLKDYSVFQNSNYSSATNSGYGVLELHSGGIMNNTSVFIGGILVINSGGLANNTIVSGSGDIRHRSNYGSLVVSNGGMARNITIERGGSVTILTNGEADGITLSSGGSLSVLGGTATNVVWTPGSGYLTIFSGAVVSFASEYYGVYYGSYSSGRLSRAMAMESKPFGSNNFMYVMSGGTVSNIDQKGGEIHVWSGGTASTIRAGAGDLRISSGGTATFSASHSSYIFFDVASDTYVQGTSNGIAFEMKDAYLSGYIADNHNYIFVSSGGVAENTTLNSGLLYVCSSGTAKNTFVNSRGWLEVFSGGTLTGKVSLKWGGYYSMFEGAVLDFDLTQTEAGEVALVNDLSLIQGTPLYTLTVSDTQASGTYTLAEGASMFKGTLTVQNVSGEELGTLTVGGELETENRRYALSLEDDRLWLTCYALSTGRIIEKTVTVNAYEIYREPIVNSGGRLNVSSGGTATGIMENGGFVYIEDGADVSFIPNTISGLIISQGSATVHSGTKAVGVTVNSRGSMYVFSGGTALEIMENGGYVEVVDGADVSFKSNTISWMVCEAPATIHSGTTANSATISGGCLYISSGGTANNTLNRGSMVVFSGGIANSTTINDGSMRVSSGGIAFKTMVKGHDHSPEVHVLSSGTAENVLVYENGDLHIASGGKLTGRIICLGNTETLECGMVALDDGAIVDFDLTHSLPGAAARINNLSCFGGVTSRWPRDLVYTLTVNADQIEGIYRLADQADVFHQTITVVNKAGEELGTISLDETTIISNVSYTLDLSDQVLSLKIGENNTPSPYTSDGLILSNYANVVNNEIYHDTLIIAGGRLEISSGGTANVIMIGSGGKTEVNTSGNANNTEISSNGHMDVFSGGSVSNTEVHSGGRFTISSGGTANRTIINSGVSFVVGNGVKAFEIVENGGYVDVKAGADVTFASNSYSNLFLYRASATVHSGTTAVSTFVSKDARFHIFSGGMADSTLILQGSMFVYSDGMADNTEIYDRSRLIVSSGGIAKNTIVNSNADFVIDGIANDTTVNSGGGMGVVGVANNIAVSCGEVDIYSGGMANNTIILGDSKCMAVVEVSHSGIANNTSVNQYGSMLVSSGGTANFTTVNSGGEITIKLQGIANVTTIGSGGGVSVVESGGIVNSANVCSGGSLSVYANAKLTGQMTFAEGAVVSARQRAILDFDISGLTPEAGARVNNLALIQGTPTYTLTVGGDLKQGIYTYLLAGGAEDFASTITVVDQAGDKLGVLTVGETVRIGYDDYTLNLTDGTLSVTVEVPDLTPTETQGTSEQVSWEATGANSYIVEYSTDSFEHVIQVVATGNAIDSPELPAGNYQWRVKADANSEWAIGEAIVSEVDPSMPKVVQSNADDNDDLFFANPVGTWDDCSFALHVGSINDWTGTNEIISASGKGRIQNLFFGSSDPNVLCLTDGENGDAIFVDDVYTDLPEGIEEHTARLYKIQEVRAGFGDDIVDMTSQRFEYFGEGLTIRGGAGNDTIWANKGNNMLFGDAGNDRIVGASGNDIIAGGIGNDRMHGGGGNDIFTFGENWGVDTVEQLATGSVTLWFVSGDESNWNAETMTYTDGDNSVTVTGVTSVELRFGNNTTEQYTMLAQAGAFLDFTTERIFEEAGKGVLASL